MRAPRHTGIAAEGKLHLQAAVTVRWGDTVLVSRTLREGGEATIGAGLRSLVSIPCDALGVAAATVARVASGAPIALVPRGAVAFHERPGAIPRPVTGPAEIPLGAGEVVSFPTDGFLVTIAASEAQEPAWSARPQLGASLRAAAPILVAGLAHALVLGLSAQSARAASLEEPPSAAEEMSRYLAAAEARTAAEEQAIKGGAGTSMGKRVDVHDGDGRADGGARAAGREGDMGSTLARARDKGRYAISGAEGKNKKNTASRADALADARSFGLAGVLASEASRSPFVSFGQVTVSGHDPFGARGELWAPSLGETFGTGGLSLAGTGEGGGGNAAGIGSGFIGVGTGHGSGMEDGTGGLGTSFGRSYAAGGYTSYGRGCYGCRQRRRSMIVNVGDPSVTPLGADPFPGESAARGGAAPASAAESIRRVSMSARDSLRACYTGWRSPIEGEESFLDMGEVATRFVVRPNGRVVSAVGQASAIPLPEVGSCVARVFQGLTFAEAPDGRSLGVSVRVHFWMVHR